MTTAVLVHAAWADASSWNKVIPQLQRKGLRVVSAQLPLTSLADDAAALRRYLHRIDGPVVLAAHSYGGAVITAGATGQANVRALVYIAAMAPDQGEKVIDLLHRAPAHPLAPALSPDADGLLWMSEEGFANAVAHQSPADAALLAATQKPISIQAIVEPMPAPAWRDKPSWYFVAQDDRMIAADTQRFMAERAGSTLEVHATGHTPLLSAPDAVTAIILKAAA
jgi:pimeloyl-ACP methyl ester carboxylesterase